MRNPTISVVIPNYNREETLLEAVGSVLDQEIASEIEVIIVDDGSSVTIDYDRHFSDRSNVRVIRHEANKGAAAARNTGARAARGAWIAWLDSDDLWMPGKLQVQLDHLEGLGPDAGSVALSCGFDYLWQSGKRHSRFPMASDNPLHFFAGCWFCPGSTVVMSKALFNRVGGYDEGLGRLEDLDWFARMALAGGRLETVSNHLPLVQIRIGDKADSETLRKSGERLMAAFNEKADTLPAGALRNLAAYLEIEYAASAIKRDGAYIRGFAHLLKSWWLRPRTRLHLYDFWPSKD